MSGGTNSGAVAAGELATAAQYNNLRTDVLDTSSGHQHDGSYSAATISATTFDGAATVSAAWAFTNTVTVGVDDTGKDVKFFGATSGSFLLWDESDDALELTDSSPLKIGDGADMQVYHDGSNSYLTNATGALKLATETSGIAVTIGHTTSETTVADNLTVTGDTTLNGSVTLGNAAADVITVNGTIAGASALVFEGATSDAYETTLAYVDPTADRTVYFPNQTGYLAVLAAASTTQVTATPEEINLIDGGTSRGTDAIADGDGVLINDAGTMRMTTVETLATYMEGEINAFSLALTHSNTLTVGVSDTGYDVQFFGATANTYMLWDANTDDLVLTLGAELYFYDAAGGEHIKSDGTDMTIYAGTDLNLTAGTDINIPANIGLTFGNDGEKIEGDGTDLTIAGNNINLTATADVVIPADVGITFGSGEKIEGDSTDLTVTSGAKINLTATSDVVIPSGVGLILDGSGSEKIESDGTDISISVGSNGDINIPVNIGMTFGADGEKIEGDGTDLTISGNIINLSGAVTATGIIKTDDSTEATTTIDGSLQTDGGLSVAKDAVFGDDVFLLSDSAVLNMGAGNDVTFTHDGTAGLTIAATPISIDATGELHLNSTTGDIKLQDGGTDQIAFDLDGTSGVVIMKPMVDSDDLEIQQYDGTAVLRIEDAGYLNVINTTASSSTTTGSAIFGGGIGVAGDAYLADDAYLLSDSAVLGFGADKDTTLTHTDGSGLTLNSTNKIMFNDASQFIQGSSATILALGATDEIDLTASAVDLNGTLDVSGAAVFNTSIVVDNITLNGSTITDSSGAISFGNENLTTTGFIAVGTDPAEAGDFRIPNASYINARNGADNGQLQVIGYNSSDVLKIGSAETISVSSTTVDIAGGAANALTLGDATTAVLHVNNDNDSTDAAGGLVFGSSGDTNLYRAAANVLGTDDTFRLVGGGTIDTDTGDLSLNPSGVIHMQNNDVRNVTRIFVNDTANANMTRGVSINMGDATNEGLAIKGSAVGHGMTSETETDTFGAFKLADNSYGGLQILAKSANEIALLVYADYINDDIGKTTTANGAVQIRARKKDGTSVGNPGTDANLMVAQSNGLTRFIWDAEGSAHADVEWVAFSHHNDLAMVRDLEAHLTQTFGKSLTYHQSDFEEAGIVGQGSFHYEDGNPHAMVNWTRLAMLHHGTLAQVGDKLEEHETIYKTLNEDLMSIVKVLPPDLFSQLTPRVQQRLLAMDAR